MTALAWCDDQIEQAREAILRGDEPLENLLLWYADACAEKRLEESDDHTRD